MADARGGLEQVAGGARGVLGVTVVGERRGKDPALAVEDDRRLDLRRDLRQVGERLRSLRAHFRMTLRRQTVMDGSAQGRSAVWRLKASF